MLVNALLNSLSQDQALNVLAAVDYRITFQQLRGDVWAHALKASLFKHQPNSA